MKIGASFHSYAKHLTLEPRRYESIIDDLNRDMESHLTVKDILEAAATATPNRDMLRLVGELRIHDLITGIITDNNTERIEVLRRPFNLDKFYPMVVSADVGLGKWQNTKILSNRQKRGGF